MLTLNGARRSFCDGVSRREFLRIGGLGLGGLSLANLLQADAHAQEAGRRTGSANSIIMIYLAGGIAHQDFVDLKPNAPQNIRGEFKPIATNVNGIQICEHLPLLAKRMDQLAIIRSLADSRDEHSSDHCLSGYFGSVRQRTGQPCLGSVVSKVLGPTDRVIPPFVGLTKECGHKPWADVGQPGRLGVPYAPARPDGEDIEAMRLQGVTLDGLRDRQKLLASFDRFRRRADDSLLTGMDRVYERAFDVLTSSRLLDALDVTQEDPRTRDRYGIGSDQNVDDGPPLWNDQILIARRLIECGVRCVTLGYGRWDYHNNNFGQLRERLPTLDQGLSALLDDLRDRGLEKTTTVVVWGEFGRTPKINPQGGRDHWAAANCALVAGGGLRTGQVIGSTDRDGGMVRDRPVSFQNVFATLYHSLGIDPLGFIRDSAQIPIRILDQNPLPIHELI